MKHLNNLTTEALSLCDKIATFSAKKDRIERFCLTSQMEDLHAFLSEYFMHSLTMQCDQVGNVVFSPVKFNTSKKRILIGSHLDTVSNAGRYDGILGVVMGLLGARELSNEEVAFHTVGFADEEGARFGCRFLGSLNFIGELPPDYLHYKDIEGISLKQALLLETQTDFSDYFTENTPTYFIELHSEQGLCLHQAKKSLGIVECICGQAVVSFTFHGCSAHAVSKYDRRDALLSACELVSQAQKIALEYDDLHVTFGRINNSPNQSNVVSDQTTVTADVRHVKNKVRMETIQAIITLAQQICTTQGTQLEVDINDQKTVKMDRALLPKLAEICEQNQLAYQPMISFAGHDALVMSAKIPSALIFLRDNKGISHHPEESVDHQAIKDGFQLLQQLTICQ